MKRFIEAQESVYETVLQELKNRKKETYWMWFIFPQIEGLGNSYTARLYSLKNNEIKAYINDKVLYNRLLECCELIKDVNVEEVFGPVDTMKLKSSLTMFEMSSNNHIFTELLNKHFGERCEFTISSLS